VSRCVWIAVTSIVEASSSVRRLTYDLTVKSEAAEFTQGPLVGLCDPYDGIDADRYQARRPCRYSRHPVTHPMV
jgi:hypothetical protein